MNHLTQSRIDIATVLQTIQTAWTAYDLKIETDNREVIDQSTQDTPYLKVNIKYVGASQADLSENPIVIQRGQIMLSAVVKDGSGRAAADQLLEFVMPYFDMQSFSLVRCQAAEVHEGKSIKGWWYSPALVNFWYQRTRI